MDSGRGNAETLRLKANIEDQLDRLLTQLQDLEDMRDDFDNEEYEEARRDTIQQMQEFEQSLSKMKDGNMTLVDEIGGMQLAIQEAIRSAFKSPEVIKMFAKKENGALRTRLASVAQDHKLAKITHEAYVALSAEILNALEKLGEVLEPHEKNLLETASRSHGVYAEASSYIDSAVVQSAADAAQNARNV
ncbi:lzic [Symbiodinium microadriaticum]|nr:lzic [Symbiodinium microadriaticum]